MTDILIYTIQNGTEKTKAEWIEDFKKIGIDVPQFVLDYEVDNREKNYYEKNKDKLNKKFTCKCGGKFTKLNKSNHLKSKKHQNYLASLSSSASDSSSFQSTGLK